MKLKENKKVLISLILNIIIIVFTLAATIIMFTGFKFMKGPEIVLESTKLGMFRFFTVDSNLSMGIVALLFAIEEVKLLQGKIKEIARVFYLLKIMTTTAVALTFVIVFTYLGNIVEYGIASMLMNSNLFFHLLIPVLSIVTFTIFESNNKLCFKDSFYGLLPTVLYSIYYLLNVLIHTRNGIVPVEYDWYWFVQNGVWTTLIVMPLILFITWLISVGLWKINNYFSLKG